MLFKIKNLDTGEYLDIEETGERFSVMRLHSGEDDSAKDDDKSSEFQELSEEEEDYYFDAHLEDFKREMKQHEPLSVKIPSGGRIRFLRISGYQIVADREKRKFCIFTLEIQCPLAAPSRWKVYRRYSEFRKLSRNLRTEGHYVPVIPPKSVFTSISHDFISKRSRDLEAWLNHLSIQHSIDPSALDPLLSQSFQQFLVLNANHPPYSLPSPQLEPEDDRVDGTYADDSKSSRNVLPLRDEKKSYELDWKMAEILNRPKVGVDDFEMVRVIGKGSFGKVTLVRKKTTRTLYAMKVLSKSHVLKRKQIEHTKTERRVLGTIDHPFIVKLHYAFQSSSKLYFVLDYAAGGELFFHLTRMKRFPEHISQFYAAELASALDALHQIGVIYRDLKPENILLDREGHIKLADFGLAKEGVLDAVSGASSLCGTPEYLSPEVLNRQGHGHAVDWWNLGMVLYEMMTGLPPWYTTDKAVLFERIRTAPIKFPLYLSRPAAHFMHHVLNKDPSLRLGSRSSEEIFTHPFFSSIDWIALNSRRISPPFDPCRDLKDDTDTHNFESEFTQMATYSIDEMEAKGTQSQTLPYRVSPDRNISPGNGSSTAFSQFTFGEDSYLEKISSRWGEGKS